MMQAKEKTNTVTGFKDKNVLVVGLARSGTGAANLLSALGARVAVSDRKPRSELKDQIERLAPTVTFAAEDNADEMIERAEMVVVSPGVPLDIPLLTRARIRGIPVIGELELAYQVVAGSGLSQISQDRLQGKTESEPGRSKPAVPGFIGVTGTNGKSTTTTLIDLMLKKSGYQTLLGGNIGNALTEEILNTGSGTAALDYIVAEISSFQLESIDLFRPKIAAILNITSDHLDRYPGMKEYIDAKTRIFENQSSDDCLVLNADDPLVTEIIDEKMRMKKGDLPRIFYFSREKEVEGIYCRDGMIYSNLGGTALCGSMHRFPSAPSALISIDEVGIKGAHNLENAMAASLTAMLAGCSPEALQTTLRGFSGLEHRLEFVGEYKGVTYINDSKGTNVGAVAKSLENLENIILIMGGLDKGNDYSVLQDMIKKKVKLLVLIGQAREVIEEALGAFTEIYKVNDLREAVALSMSKAAAGDVVMLSPGCASFDMFKDFEDRGRKFKEAVRDSAGEY